MRISALVLAIVVDVGLVACAAGDDKPAITDLPSALDDALSGGGKDDSGLRPWYGGALLVGDQRFGSFDATHGWIGYEAALAPGAVDIDLADGSGGALDTLLVIYGPRRADGSYPTTPLALNDDVVPGDNVASHVVLDVAVEGTYKIVASTYDNYAAWPTNSSIGDFLVTIKCPRIESEGLDACGPHLRRQGEACFDDVVCGEGATCEGEIVCAPGTNCLWVQPGVCAGDLAWVVIDAKQCDQNAWQQDADATSSFASFDDAELNQLHGWLENLGVFASAVGRVDHESDIVCSSCSCGRGDSMLVEVPTLDARTLVADHGFAWALDVWRATAPVQCGDNPWEQRGFSTERDAVRSWAADSGAPLGMVGFVHQTYDPLVCLACSCARGDLLVVTPSAAGDGERIDQLGFGTLYEP